LPIALTGLPFGEGVNITGMGGQHDRNKQEVFAELRKIKLTSLKDQGFIVTELTKRHKMLLDAFNVEINIS